MKGVNKLILNQETMLQAIQEYLDKRYTDGVDPGPKVLHVSHDYETQMFHITVEGRKS